MFCELSHAMLTPYYVCSIRSDIVKMNLLEMCMKIRKWISSEVIGTETANLICPIRVQVSMRGFPIPFVAG